jgi:hypothetical protein
VRCDGGGVFRRVSELGCRLLIFVRMGCAFDGSYVSRLELEMLHDVGGCGVGITVMTKLVGGPTLDHLLPHSPKPNWMSLVI